MTVQLIKFTGEFHTVGEGDDAHEEEITEIVRETEVDEETKDRIARSERTMAELKTRDTEFWHAVRVIA